MKTLVELYQSILSSVGMTADSQGFISTLTPGSDTPKPWTVDGRRGVLPTEEQLKQPDWTGRIGFHPLLQNLSGGDSRVLEKFRERMNANADFITGMLLIDLAQLAVKKDLHKDLTPEQAQYLGPLSDADEKFVKLLVDLTATKRLVKKNFEFVRFSVIKGRVWQGQKRSRVAVAHFPLYEQLPKENKPTTIGTFKLRIADVKMLRNVYEFLFPGLREAGFYEIGSDSKTAPSMESLMQLYAKFTDSINTAVALLEPVISTSNALMIVNDWRDAMADITPYIQEIRRIPFLEGNAPSERVAAAAAPAIITDAPATSVRKTIAAEQAPVMPDPADLNPHAVTKAQVSLPLNHQPIQEAPQVQAGQPRFKLGISAPVVSAGSGAHQITDAQAHTASIGYSNRGPLVGAVTPTPPVGTQIAQPQFQQPQYQQPAPAVPQAAKLPDTARVFNGQVYIPVTSTGVSAIPAGAVMIEGQTYVPLAGAGMVSPGGGGQVIAGMQQPMGMAAGFGQPITDPSQVPGLTPEEVVFYRTNPVMFQHFIQQLQSQGLQQNQAQFVQRQQAVPRYLQRAVDNAQQQQQQQYMQRGFFNR